MRRLSLTVHTLVSSAGSTVINASSDWLAQAVREEFHVASVHSVRHEASLLSAELDQLSWCLEEYQKAGGSVAVTEFYKRRYAPIVCWLEAASLLSSPRTERHFDPKSYRPLRA